MLMFDILVAITDVAIFKGKKAVLTAGPYLYTFNRWAVSWLENQNITPLITPLENSKDNLLETFPVEQRKRVLVTVFAYPALFRMRFQLPESYDFMYFSDRQESVFKALSTPDGSFVLPDNPFSIVDKQKTLKSMGFSHFLIDLSKTDVKRNELKQIMSAYYNGRVLPETSRFNWKEGFYSPDKVEKHKIQTENQKKQYVAQGKKRKK